MPLHDDRDASVPETDQVADGVPGRALVVHDNHVAADPRGAAVEENDRNPALLRVLEVGGFARVGWHHDEAVNALVEQDPNRGALGAKVLVRVREDDLEALRVGRIGDATDGL